jgi:hypothetical protein
MEVTPEARVKDDHIKADRGLENSVFNIFNGQQREWAAIITNPSVRTGCCADPCCSVTYYLYVFSCATRPSLTFCERFAVAVLEA